MQLAVTKKYRNRIHPQKFALWLAMAGIMMMFVSMTSAYIVRQASGNWQEYPIPSIFFISTAILIVSSITMHISWKGYTNGKENQYRLFMLLSFILGIVFIIMQYKGWNALYNIGVPLDGNPSGSFFYLISGMHIAHILGGLAAMFACLIFAITYDFKVTPKRKIKIEMVVHYWHFVDALWLFLFTFLLFS